jgi:hypothetical protein
MGNKRFKYNYIRNLILCDKYNHSNNAEGMILLSFTEEPYFNDLMVAISDIEYCIPVLDKIYYNFINN